MKKHIIALTAIGIIALIPVKQVTADIAIGGMGCCTQELEHSCERWFCTHNGQKTEYTNCTTCKTSGTTLEKNGSYEPCGDGAVMSVDVGKCVMAIIGPILTLCDAGEYGNGRNCTACPEPGTSEMGATEITECYIPAGTVMTDTTGTYTYTEDCYYSTSSDIAPIEPGTKVEL